MEFTGVDDEMISKCVIEWAGAVRCAIAWLVDAPGPNYWSVHFSFKHVES
jgi:hypothetical protein